VYADLKDQHQFDPALVNYLAKPRPHCLEIGAGWNGRPGWLATDLNPPPGYPCMNLDATKSFNIPSESFDFIYSEHMIEHVSFEDGLNMLEECNRILKPSGIIRIVTPSLGFLLRVMSSDRCMLEERYREWSVTNWVPGAPKVTNAFFLNNFARAWGHTFIYDRETLELALQLSGFEPIVSCELNKSDHSLLCGLANVGKIPPGFLDLESMVLEGTKARSITVPAPEGRSLALGKRATQSSTSEWSLEANPEAEAARVVSGHFTGSYNCHTGLDSPPWWRVDLHEVQEISEVRIYNRVSTDPATLARASRLEIQVSEDDRNWKTVFRKESKTLLSRPMRKSPFIWFPEEPVFGRYFRIQLLDKQYLHLEQVEIYGPYDRVKSNADLANQNNTRASNEAKQEEMSETKSTVAGEHSVDRLVNDGGRFALSARPAPQSFRWTVVAAHIPGYLHSAALQELVEAVYFGLKQLDCQVRLSNGEGGFANNAILIGAHLYSREECTRVPDEAIIYNSEHVDSHWMNDNYLSLLRRAVVWDYSDDNARRLQEKLGRSVTHVPIGYVPQFTRSEPRQQSDEDIDVLFIGSSGSRRNSVLDSLRGRGLRVHHAFSVYGDERDQLISRAKVVLNIHQHVPGALEILRIAYLLSNSKAVVSELNSGEKLDADLDGAFVTAPYEQVADTASDLVADPHRRATIAKAGYRKFICRSQAAILREALRERLDERDMSNRVCMLGGVAQSLDRRNMGETTSPH
jgi:predicted SAM-dependent methyltransferase